MTPKLLSLLAAAALIAPASAHAVATSNDCLVWAGRYTLVDQTRFAVVFAKDNPHVNSAAPTNYGCVFSREKAFVLANQGEGATQGDFQLDGRYVGYTVTFRDPAVAASSASIVVFDAKGGTTKVSAPAWPEPSAGDSGQSTEVTSFVLKPNGSVAWIGRIFARTEGGTLAVQKREAGATATVELDRGADIAGGSLARSRDGQAIYWTRGSQPRSAPLR